MAKRKKEEVDEILRRAGVDTSTESLKNYARTGQIAYNDGSTYDTRSTTRQIAPTTTSYNAGYDTRSSYNNYLQQQEEEKKKREEQEKKRQQNISITDMVGNAVNKLNTGVQEKTGMTLAEYANKKKEEEKKVMSAFGTAGELAYGKKYGKYEYEQAKKKQDQLIQANNIINKAQEEKQQEILKQQDKANKEKYGDEVKELKKKLSTTGISNLSSEPTMPSVDRTAKNSNIDEKLKDIKVEKSNIQTTGKEYTKADELWEKGDYFNAIRQKVIDSENGFAKDSELWKDGYQFGDITKTTLSTAGSLANEVVRGMVGVSEGISDNILYLMSDIAEGFGDKKTAQRWRQNAMQESLSEQYVLNPIEKELNPYSVAGQMTKQAFQGVGQVSTYTGLGIAGNILGGGALGLSEKGVKALGTIQQNLLTYTTASSSARTEAYLEGASDSEARVYALLSGLTEMGSEALFGGAGKATDIIGLGRGLGDLDDKLAKTLTKNVNSTLAKNLIQFGVKSSGEGFEEVVSGVGSAVWKKLTYMSEEDLGKLLADQKLLDEFIVGSMTSAIMQTPGSNGVIQTTKQGRDFITGLTAEQEKELKISEEAKKLIEKSNEAILNEEGQELTTEQQIAKLNEEIKKLNEMKQIAPVREDIKQFKGELNQYQRPVINEEDSLIDSAKKYDLKYKDTSIDSIQKILDKTGVKGQVNAEMFLDENGDVDTSKSALWNLTENEDGSFSRSIIINPFANEDVLIQELAVHELTHDIINKNLKESDSLQKGVMKFLEKNVENFADKKAEIEDAYANLKNSNGEFLYERGSDKFNAIVQEEIVANVMQEQFGNQEFINKLVKYEPNWARRAYNWVIEKLNNLTGGRVEKLFWTDVKNKFMTAYASEGNFKSAEDNNRYYFNNVDYFNKSEYNNAIEEEVDPKTWKAINEAIGREELNSGVYETEAYDYAEKVWKNYTIMYESKGEYKIVDSEIVNENNYTEGANKNGINKYSTEISTGDGITRSTRKNSEWNNEQIENRGETTDDARLSNKNERYTSTNRENNIEINRNQKNVKNSEESSFNLTKDNQGRVLSDYVKEKTKNVAPQLRDDNGNLYLMYHGSPNGMIQDLDEGTYFTPNKKYAERYTNTSASSISTGKIENNPKVYEAYLIMEKPFDLTDSTAKDIYINEYIKGGNALGIDPYMSDAEYNNIKNIDWTEVEDLKEWLKENHPEYDGIIADEGGDGGYGEEVVLRGQSFIPFSKEQIIKANDNNTRYSINLKGEMLDNKGKKVTLEGETGNSDKTLLALHNLNEDKLKGILELGGIPVPSIAITNPNIVNHNRFGDITIVLNKDTINPDLDSRNEVYDRDVWSPTFPQVDYEINGKDIKNIADKLGIESWKLKDYVENHNKPEFLLDILLRDEEILDKYIKDNNLKYETKYKNADIHKWFNKEESIKKFIINNKMNYDKFMNDSELREKYYDVLRNEFNTDENEIEAINKQIDKLDFYVHNKEQISTLKEDFDIINGKSQIADAYETKKEKRRIAEENGINEHLQEQIKNIFSNKGIYNGKEYITENGRRTFWELHDEYNLENIVNALTKQDTKGTQNWIAGYGQIQAKMGKKFNSMLDIKANENLLTDLSEENNILTETRNNIEEDIDEIVDNNDTDIFVVSELLADFASGDLTIENFKNLTRKYYQSSQNVSDELINKIIKDLNALKNLPTDYFEAKPQRAVGFDEIDTIILPNNISKEVKKQLKDLGVKTIEYNPEIENEKADILKSLEEYKFSVDKDFGTFLNKPKKGTRTTMGALRGENFNLPIPIATQYRNELTEQINNSQMSEADKNMFNNVIKNFKNNELRENYNNIKNQLMLVDKLAQVENTLESVNERLDSIAPVQEQTTEEIAPTQEYVTKSDNSKRLWAEAKKEANGNNNFEINPEQLEMLELKYPVNTNGNRTGRNWLNLAEDIGKLYAQEGMTQEQMQKEGRMLWYNYEPLKNITRYDNVAKKNEFTRLNGTKWMNAIEKAYNENLTGSTRIENETISEENNKTYAPVEKVNFKDDNLIKQSEDLSEKEVAKILTESKGNPIKNERSIKAILQANLIDKGMVFEKLSRKANNRELQGKWDYTLTSEARGQNAIGNARTDNKGNVISKSLTDIINEVGDNKEDFYNYMYHQLNIDRMTLEDRFSGDTGINYENVTEIKNKPVFGEEVTADISKNIVDQYEIEHPEFKEFAQDVYQFLDANTKELVDNGVISKETQELWKEMYPHYVPISRVNHTGIVIGVPLDSNKTGVNSPIKRARGGSGDINPLFETMANRTLQTYRASARNSFGMELKNTLQSLNQLNQNIESTDIDSIIDEMSNEESNKELLQPGNSMQNPTFTIFENGERVTYEISPDMFDALKPKDANSILSKTFKLPSKLSSFHRGVLTEYNPVFMITNAIKDAQDVLINSQHPAKTYAKFPEAYAQIIGKGQWYQEYIQHGGEQNSYFKDGEFETNKEGLKSKIKDKITLPLKGISRINNIIEMSPRLAEYIASREQGKSIETSMLDASRVTTNFKAGGDITKFANRNGFTFLNASVQGFQQQVRNIQEANAKGLKGYAVLAMKYGIAGLPALLLNNLVWDDDEDYEDLQDYVKDNYYVIGKIGDTFIRIPKGRMTATIQKVFSNAGEFITEDKINSDNLAKVFWDDLKENVEFAIDNIAPNNPLNNNVLAPITQAITGKTWYGGDMIPKRLQDKPASEQYDESTDSISKWIGETLGVSPIKVNYLLNQYSGGLGDILLPPLTPQAENNVLEDKFTSNATMKNKYPGLFFDKIDELKVNSNSEKATDKDILKYKYMSGVQSEVSELYKQKREIQNSNKSDERKKEELKEVQSQINTKTKEAMQNLDNISIYNDTSKIGNQEYYKLNGEWKKLTEKEKTKNQNIPTSSYVKYKNATEGLKTDKEKINALIVADLNSNEKKEIYKTYLGKEDETYNLMEKANVNIDEYLRYKSLDLKADKDANGKSISGSKKAKVYNYLENSSLNYEQRLLLAGSQYVLTSSEKEYLANYIVSLPISSNEMIDMFNGLSKNYTIQNGQVTWK